MSKAGSAGTSEVNSGERARAGTPPKRDDVLEYLSNLSTLDVEELIDTLKETWGVTGGPVVVAAPWFAASAARAESARPRTSDKLVVTTSARHLELLNEVFKPTSRRLWGEVVDAAGIAPTFDEKGRFCWPPDLERRIKDFVRDRVAKMSEGDLHRSRLIGMLEVRRDQMEEWSREVGDLFDAFADRLHKLADGFGVPVPGDAGELLSYSRELFGARLYGANDEEQAGSRFTKGLNVLRGGGPTNWTGAAIIEIREAIEREVDCIIGDRFFHHELTPDVLVHEFTTVDRTIADVRRVLAVIAPAATPEEQARIHEAADAMDGPGLHRRPGRLASRGAERLTDYLRGRFGDAFGGRLDWLADRLEEQALRDLLRPPVRLRTENDPRRRRRDWSQRMNRMAGLMADLIWGAAERRQDGYRFTFPIVPKSRREIDNRIRSEFRKKTEV
ncbi:MAG: hypothetical protein KF764_16945 [Labilithrix sp.]|nr:hypothetical protein [Labilithrix sp.]